MTAASHRILELPTTGLGPSLPAFGPKARPTRAFSTRLRAGIVSLEGVDYAGIEAKLDRIQGANCWLTMGLREGKNREIKRRARTSRTGSEPAHSPVVRDRSSFSISPEGKVEEVKHPRAARPARRDGWRPRPAWTFAEQRTHRSSAPADVDRRKSVRRRIAAGRAASRPRQRADPGRDRRDICAARRRRSGGASTGGRRSGPTRPSRSGASARPPGRGKPRLRRCVNEIKKRPAKSVRRKRMRTQRIRPLRNDRKDRRRTSRSRWGGSSEMRARQGRARRNRLGDRATVRGQSANRCRSHASPSALSRNANASRRAGPAGVRRSTTARRTSGARTGPTIATCREPKSTPSVRRREPTPAMADTPFRARSTHPARAAMADARRDVRRAGRTEPRIEAIRRQRAPGGPRKTFRVRPAGSPKRGMPIQGQGRTLVRPAETWFERRPRAPGRSSARQSPLAACLDAGSRPGTHASARAGGRRVAVHRRGRGADRRPRRGPVSGKGPGKGPR